MKKKSFLYLMITMLGVISVAFGIILYNKIPDNVDGVLTGLGVGLVASAGISMWRFFRMEKKDPEKWKQHEIESQDERNVIIRLKAQAKAGEILQWAVMAVAWVAIFLDAPLWVILTAIGIFFFKTVLELILMFRYQKEM